MPAQVTTGVTKAISGNQYNNNIGHILMAGNIQNPVGAVNGLPTFVGTTLAANLADQPGYASILASAVSPASSGNVGTQKAFSSLKFGYQKPGQYVISKVTTSLAGSANGTMQAMDNGGLHRNPSRFYAYQRYDITSTTMAGVVTKGGAAGATVLASGIDGTTGTNADKSFSITPNNLTWRQNMLMGGVLPSSLTLPKEFGHITSVG
jgi:hypothetical protein